MQLFPQNNHHQNATSGRGGGGGGRQQHQHPPAAQDDHPASRNNNSINNINNINNNNINNNSASNSRRHKVEQVGAEIHELIASAPRSNNHNNTNNKQQHQNGNTSISPETTTTFVIGHLQELISNYPEAIFYQDSQHRTVLHIASAYQAPLAIVDYLIHQEQLMLQQRYYPKSISPSIQTATAKGLLPLHYACREQAPADVIRCLVEQYPQALSIPTADGWLPLHMACARKATTFVIRYLLQQYPLAATQATNCGRYALHFACANRLEVSAVKEVYDNAPAVVRHVDKSEWNPLHVACAYSSLDVIAFLIEEWKDGLKVRGGGVGRTPLHLACSERQPLEIVVHLVLQHHSALHEFDANALLPLHAACKGGAPVDVIQFLISEWPASAFQLGNTPDEIAAYILKRQHKNNTKSGGVGNHSGAAAQQLKLWLEKICREQEERSVYVPPPTVSIVPGSTSGGGVGVGHGHAPHHQPFNPHLEAIVNHSAPRAMRNNGRSTTGGPNSSCEDVLVMGFEGPPPTMAYNRPATIAARTVSDSSDFGARSGGSSATANNNMNNNMNTASTIGRSGAGRPMQPAPPAMPQPHYRQISTASNASTGSTIISTTTANTRGSMHSATGGVANALAACHAEGPAIRAAGERLHQACEMPQNLEVIQQVLTEFPDTIDCKAYGILPMHTACLNQANVDVLSILHRHAPDAIRKRDGEGNLPVHLACYSGAPFDSIEYLVATCWPESVKLINANGESPLARALTPFYDNPDPNVIALLKRVELQVDLESEEEEAAATAAAALASTTPPRSSIPPQQQQNSKQQNASAPRSPKSPKVFTAPMGVDDVRAALKKIRQTKKTSQRKLELNEEDEDFSEEDSEDEQQQQQQQQQQQPSSSILSQQQRSFPIPPPPMMGTPRQATPSSSSSAQRHQHPSTNTPNRNTTTTTTTTPTISSSSSRQTVTPRQHQTPPVQPPSMQRTTPFRRVHTGDTNSAPGGCGGGGGSGPGLQRTTAFRGRLLSRGASSSDDSDFEGGSTNADDPHQPAQRPGVVQVNEPGMRPDSAMFRAAYGGTRNQTSSGRSFEAPPGVAEVRALVSTLRESQRISKRDLDLPLNDSSDEGINNSNDDGLATPAVASSFYQAALQESDLATAGVGGAPVTNDGMHHHPNETRGLNRGVSGGPVNNNNHEIASSFYQAALAAGGVGGSSPVGAADLGSPCTPGGGAMYSSFYRAAVEASGQHGVNSPPIAAPVPLAQPGENQEVASSFYREALEAAQREGRGGGMTTSPAAASAGAAQRPGIVMVNEPGMNPTSAMYRAAYGSDERAARPGVVAVNEPGMNPTSAMYRAAYGNPHNTAARR